MNNRLTISVLCVVMLEICLGADGKQANKAEPQQARQIRAVLASQVDAWNRGDLPGFMRGYWQSDQLSFYSGATKTNGWQTTIDRYRSRYQGEGREMGHLDFTDLQVEMLGPRAAFVRGHWRLKMATSEPNGLFTLIFRKFDDGWKIIHDHTG